MRAPTPIRHATAPQQACLRLLTGGLLAVVAITVGAGHARAGIAGVEAETFALPAAAGQVMGDGTASAGSALLVWTTATATGTLATTATTAITVRARGDQCQGAPVLQLAVDGVVAGSAPVADTGWADKVFPGSWGAGSHRISLSYTNDIAGQGCDRNLWVDRVSSSTAPAAALGVEAERMALPATNGTTFADTAASGGAGLLIWNNGGATTTLAAPAGRRLVVRARGNSCLTAPRMTVAVDGQVTLDTPVRATAWADYPVPGTWPGGSHGVRVSFTNDYRGSGCDRNLRLDVVTLQAPVPTGRVFGLSSDGPDAGISTAQATASSLGRHLDVVNFYEAWVWGSPLPVTQLREIAAGGAEPEITWEPWDPRLGATQPDYTLARITAGAYDGYITGWARDAAAYGSPMMLRFGHEMNGNWYPWSPAVNGGSPTAYVAAYRHVHDLFRAAGATNVSWVWSPNIVQGMPTALNSVYPGTGYVDVVGVDGYNGGTDVPYMGGWRSPQQVFDPTIQELRRVAPGVPVVLAETGSSENGGDKAAWITSLFSYLAGTEVSGVFWFDFSTAGQADWHLATSPGSFRAAAAALSTW